MDPLSEPELSPAQEQRVRRLLADARHDEPVPADVAARLDDVLARLSAERAAGGPGQPEQPAQPVQPVDLAARRRRRLGAGLLVAAAAVVAGGVGVQTLLGGAGVEVASESGDSQGADSESLDSGGGSVEDAPAPAADVPVVRADAFRADAAGLAGARAPAARGNGAVTSTPEGWCAPREAGAAGRGGRLLAVSYEAAATEPAWLLLRPAADGRRVAELFLCSGDGVPERSASVPRG